MAMKAATKKTLDGESVDMKAAREYYREFTGGGAAPEAAPGAAPGPAEAPLPLPPDPKQWRAGQVYINSKGARGRWNGQGFEVVK
jgi:hypothetical protein